MFCLNFEKTAVSTNLIQKAMSSRIAGVAKTQGLQAGRAAVRGIESKTTSLAAKGSINSAGQRTEALKSLVPKQPQAQKVSPASPQKSNYNVYEANSDRIMKRNIPYSQM